MFIYYFYFLEVDCCNSLYRENGADPDEGVMENKASDTFEEKSNNEKEMEVKYS